MSSQSWLSKRDKIPAITALPTWILIRVLRRFAPVGTGTLAHRELWTTLAHADLRGRYRGSLLGPLWLTVATGVLVGGIGLLYGGLFGQSLDTYLPYIATSIVVWTLISTALAEASSLFIGEGSILRQLPVPASLFITRLIYRNFLVLLHNLTIVVLVLLFFPPAITFNIVMVPVGVAIVFANIWWMCFVTSLLGARFRDVSPIVASVLQIVFFVTPIIWRAEDLPDRAWFVNLNPFYHLIEIVRAPLLYGSTPWNSLGVCATVAVIGTAVALRLLAWSRTRLVYWL